MSKEQTPLTADRWRKKMVQLNQWRGKDIAELLELYAQAKVLEALEREVIFRSRMIYNEFILHNPKNKCFAEIAKEYYETEVKPKYKL